MGKSKITSLEVARRAGVSQSAVSRVFTSGASVSEKMDKKVRLAADDLGYRPNPIARAMITGKSRIIGLVFSYLDNQFYPLALERIIRALKTHGYHTLVFMAENSTKDVDDVVKELVAYQVEGIIAASVDMSNDLATLCEATGIPVVLFNRGQDDSRLSEVTSDNVAGGRMVANFLVGAGHKRIAHISGWQGSLTGRDRAKGFLEGLSKKGVDPVAVEDGAYDQKRAGDITRTLFSGSDHPDAIFVGNDHMAFAVMDVLRFEFGVSVPNDVSVVGYDDVPIASWPAYDLTTIQQPINQMVSSTVDTILARIEGEPNPKHILIPGPLILRGSARKPKGFTA